MIMSQGAKTLFEKVWESHVVVAPEGEPALLYIDLHLLHEVTSPQAFEGLRLAGRTVRRPDRAIATVDHNVPTTANRLVIADAIAAKQIDALRANCADFGIPLYDVQSPEQGIVHVIGPELGVTKPGMTIVCGDSHTSTHGAFGALAFGIGTSEVEHVLATQCLQQSLPKTFRITIEGGAGIGGQRSPFRHGAIPVGARGAEPPSFEIAEGGIVRSDHARASTGLYAHVAQRHAALHGERANGRPGILDHTTAGAVGSYVADDAERDIFRRNRRSQLSVHGNAEGFRQRLRQTLGGQNVLYL